MRKARRDSPSPAASAFQLRGDEGLPVDEVRVGQDGAVAWRLDLVPAREGAIPRAVQRLYRSVLPAQPGPELRERVGTEAELHRLVEPHPVHDVRLAPDVEAVERAVRAGARTARSTAS